MNLITIQLSHRLRRGEDFRREGGGIKEEPLVFKVRDHGGTKGLRKAKIGKLGI